MALNIHIARFRSLEGSTNRKWRSFTPILTTYPEQERPVLAEQMGEAVKLNVPAIAAEQFFGHTFLVCGLEKKRKQALARVARWKETRARLDFDEQAVRGCCLVGYRGVFFYPADGKMSARAASCQDLYEMMRVAGRAPFSLSLLIMAFLLALPREPTAIRFSGLRKNQVTMLLPFPIANWKTARQPRLTLFGDEWNLQSLEVRHQRRKHQSRRPAPSAQIGRNRLKTWSTKARRSMSIVGRCCVISQVPPSVVGFVVTDFLLNPHTRRAVLQSHDILYSRS